MAFVGSSGVCVRARARRANCKRARPARMALEVGARVRVAAPVHMFHYPGKRNVAFNVQGLEGDVAADVSVKNGVGTSATKPYLVIFKEPKFRAHFDDDELEAV